MTPQDKAQSLFDKMWVYTDSIDDDDFEAQKARIYFTHESAYIVCDEFIQFFKVAHPIHAAFGEWTSYWQEVKRLIGYINKPSE